MKQNGFKSKRKIDIGKLKNPEILEEIGCREEAFPEALDLNIKYGLQGRDPKCRTNGKG
jgi:hypothetical protein